MVSYQRQMNGTRDSIKLGYMHGQNSWVSVVAVAGAMEVDIWSFRSWTLLHSQPEVLAWEKVPGNACSGRILVEEGSDVAVASCLDAYRSQSKSRTGA